MKYRVLPFFSISTAAEPAPPSPGPLRRRIWSRRRVSFTYYPHLTIALHAALLLPAAFFLCFYHLGAGSHWGSYTAVDEGRHIRVAQEMWLSGRWWLPTLDGQPYFLKPPFKMWLTSMVAHLFGESNFSYRFIDALLGVGLVVLTYGFGAILFGSLWVGLFSAFFLLGNQPFLFVHGVRSAVQDTTMLFLTSLVMLIAWKFFSELPDRRGSLREAGAAGLLVGLAALTKSAAAYYVFIVLGVFSLLSGTVLEVLRRRKVFVLTVFSLSVAIPALYYIPHFVFTDHAYSGAVDHELLGRFIIGFHNPHKRNFYLRALQGGAIVPPWPLLLAGAWFAFQSFIRRSRRHLFVFVWAAVPLVGFSLLPSRLLWYLSPCYLPFALMLAETVYVALVSMFRMVKAFGGRSLRSLVPQAAAIIICLVFGSWSLLKGARAITISASHVLEEVPRLPIDLAAEELLHWLRANPGARILTYQVPQPATVERVYMNMLRPFIEEVDDAEQFQQELLSGRFAFVMTSAKLAGPSLVSQAQPGYIFLPPNSVDQGYGGEIRREPIVIYALGSGALMPASFRSGPTRIELVKLPRQNFHFGWTPIHWGNAARIMVGSGAALYIPADAVFEQMGARFSVKLARKGSSTAPGMSAAVLINSQRVGELKDIKADFSHYVLELPPLLLRSHERNLVQFLLRYDDGRPINQTAQTLLVSSITLSLRDPLLP